MTLTGLKQSINWRLEPEGDKKPAKVPFNPAPGNRYHSTVK